MLPGTASYFAKISSCYLYISPGAEKHNIIGKNV